MQPIWIIRLLFVLTLTLCGYWVGRTQYPVKGIEFSGMALVLSLFVVTLEYASRALSAKKIVLGIAGAFVGLLFSRLFRDTFPESMLGGQDAVKASFNLLFMYLGVTMALRNADRISLSRLQLFVASPREDSVLLDTSVIIDGRIRELYALGFMGKLPIVPTFVVDELQKLADSRDAGKRHTGRKGLENLEAFREVVNFQLMEKDYPEAADVDHKLIALAKEIGGTILTTDYNLAKVAVLHRVKALNLNSAAAAMRPNLNVGDQLVLSITKEGKDARQGVGYLEDGTMVVVDEAKPFIGRSVPISVLSMMHTQAGRLVFGRLLDDPDHLARTESGKLDSGKFESGRFESAASTGSRN